MSRLVEGSILTILFFLIVNVVFLNVYFISVRSNEKAAATNIQSTNEEVSECDETCQEEISEKLFAKITPLSTERQPIIQETGSQEFIIPLGTGNTSSKEYESIPGVQVSIDTSLYPNIKKVIFETYMSIPTANGYAFAKLFNVTDKHDVWFSEHRMETNTITFKESSISLDQGKKVYSVMMKSSMGYEAKLHNARIRIISE